MRSRRIQQAVLRSMAVLLIASPLAARQSAGEAARAWQSIAASAMVDAATNAAVSSVIGDHVVRRETIAAASGPIALTLIVPDSDHAAAAVRATTSGVARLEEWLGPLPSRELTVVDVAWPAGVAGAAYRGVAITSTRWLSTARDFSFERPLLAGLARQYALALSPPGQATWFDECMALYLGTRLIHEQLEGRNFETPRFFGGFVPFSLRSVLNSPRPTDPRPRLRHLPDVEQPADAPWRAASAARGSQARRCADALHTYERYVGWPAFQHLLSAFTQQSAEPLAPVAELAAAAAKVRGSDMAWFFGPAFRVDLRYDYAVSDFRTLPVDGGYETSVTVARLGEAEFPVPLLIRFADGHEITESMNGSEASQAMVYRGVAPATLASIDPDAVLLLDADRTNNTRVMTPRRQPLGVRLGLNWVVWLQDAMLAYTGVL